MEIAYAKDVRSTRRNSATRQIIAPVNRLEIRNWDLLAGLPWGFRNDRLGALREVMRKLTGRQHIFFTPSGRCAIAQILSMLPQRDVVLPACTCPLVQSAIKVAGKNIFYADLGKNSVNTTSAEYSAVAKPGRILLATHLFGIPTDIEAICELAKQRDCVVIEDAAAAFGSRRSGRLLGTFGDFGIFSFQRSKRMPAFGGAIVVNNDQVVDPAKLGTCRVVETKRAMPFWDLAQALAHNVATTPWIYNKFTGQLISEQYRDLPANENVCRSTVVNRDRGYTQEFHPYQAELLLRLLRRMDQTRKQIARLVGIYTDMFRDTSVRTFLSPQCDNAALLRFPIALPGTDRSHILQLTFKRGVYLPRNYRFLPETSEQAQFPNAVWAAEHVVLLPLFSTLPLEAAKLLAHHVVDIQQSASAA